MRAPLVSLVLTAFAACSDDDAVTTPDAARPDAASDGARPDAGRPDSGVPDAPNPVDRPLPSDVAPPDVALLDVPLADVPAVDAPPIDASAPDAADAADAPDVTADADLGDAPTALPDAEMVDAGCVQNFACGWIDLGDGIGEIACDQPTPVPVEHCAGGTCNYGTCAPGGSNSFECDLATGVLTVCTYGGGDCTCTATTCAATCTPAD